MLDYNKIVSCMCAYLSKSEDEYSEVMKQATRKAHESETTAKEQMKSNAWTYRTNREMSVQKAVAIVLPKIWLKKISSAVTFANSILPEKRYRICQPEEEIKNLPEDKTDLF